MTAPKSESFIVTDNDIDSAWSLAVAGIASATLIQAKILAEAEKDRATKIIAKEILVRLIAGDRPEPENWRYKPT
jgi:hypothetical protein